jgi:hypothetical protein
MAGSLIVARESLLHVPLVVEVRLTDAQVPALFVPLLLVTIGKVQKIAVPGQTPRQETA